MDEKVRAGQEVWVRGIVHRVEVPTKDGPWIIVRFRQNKEFLQFAPAWKDVVVTPPAPASTSTLLPQPAALTIEQATTIGEKIIRQYQQLQKDGYTHWNKRNIGRTILAGVNAVFAVQPEREKP